MFLPVSLPLLILLRASSTAADPLHIPLSRRAPATEWTMDKIHGDADYIRAKYGYLNKVDTQRRAVSGIPVTNLASHHYLAIISCTVKSHLIVSTQLQDPRYYGALTIGTP